MIAPRITSTALSIALLCLAVPSAYAMERTSLALLESLALPPGAKVMLVSANTVHNGNAMSLATYDSALSLEDTLQFYREHWSAPDEQELPAVVESQIGPWVLLSRLRDGYNTVVQLNRTERHRSVGYLSVMRLPDKPANAQAVPPLPGMELISQTASTDNARTSTLSVYKVNESVEGVTQQLVGFFSSRQWTLVFSRTHGQSNVLLLHRRDQQMEVVVSATQTGGTTVIVNEVGKRV